MTRSYGDYPTWSRAEAMYASCEPVKPVDSVDMGDVLGRDLIAGRAPVKTFSFDWP